MISEDQRPTHNMTLDSIGRIASVSERIIEQIQSAAKVEGAEGHMVSKRFKIAEVAKMVGRTPDGIRKAEKQGKLEAPPLKDNGRREPYTLGQINAMRDLWQCRPGRQPGDEAVRFSFGNFKGGVGKSTLSTHCAQFLARAGYKVLLVDCDSQGSSTMTFGFQPDADVTAEDTLLPYLEGTKSDLQYAIKRTHWDGLDLLPACLELYSGEYYLAANHQNESGEDWLELIDQGIRSVEDDYDVVLLDPPPALGMISLSVLRALDGLIVPTPPAMYDFQSTSAFFRMLEEVMTILSKRHGDEVELEFVKVLLSRKVSNRQAHEFVGQLMATSYEGLMLANPFVQSAEIDNACSQWKTVYDLDGPTSSRDTYKRALSTLDAIFDEVVELIEAVWQGRRSERTLQGQGKSMGQGAQDSVAASVQLA